MTIIRVLVNQRYHLIALVTIIIISATGCDRKPFVEHKVKLEKLGDDCAALHPSYKLVSNFGGERFEFQKCLPANYDKKIITSLRQGDTVVVNFPSIADAFPKTLYAVTLDIDSYPAYHFIQIDGEILPITSSSK